MNNKTAFKGVIFTSFLSKIDTPLDFFAIFAAVSVIFVNGFTDAPNAIFSVVSSGKLSLFKASFISGIFNFSGVLVSSFLFSGVTESILSLYKINDNRACLASFLTVIIFGIGAWLFGMPSSESHALTFSLLGVSFVLGNTLESALKSALFIFLYLGFSCFLSYILTLIIKKALDKRNLPYKSLLLLSCASLSFMHGAQDGQKFIALLLILTGCQGTSGKSYLFLILSVSLILALSTMLGGKRIITSMGKLSNKADYFSSFCSDVGAFLSLGVCSVFGMPVSTGCIKSFSIIAPNRPLDRKNKKMISKILITSLITLPVSFVLGALLYKIISLF